MKYYLVHCNTVDVINPVIEISQQQAYGEIYSAIDAELMKAPDYEGSFDIDKAEEMAIEALEKSGIFGMDKTAVIKADKVPEERPELFSWDAVILYEAVIDNSDYYEMFPLEKFFEIIGFGPDAPGYEIVEYEEKYYEFFDECIAGGGCCSRDELDDWFGISVDVKEYKELKELVDKACKK